MRGTEDIKYLPHHFNRTLSRMDLLLGRDRTVVEYVRPALFYETGTSLSCVEEHLIRVPHIVLRLHCLTRALTPYPRNPSEVKSSLTNPFRHQVEPRFRTEPDDDPTVRLHDTIAFSQCVFHKRTILFHINLIVVTGCNGTLFLLTLQVYGIRRVNFNKVKRTIW